MFSHGFSVSGGMTERAVFDVVEVIVVIAVGCFDLVGGTAVD